MGNLKILKIVASNFKGFKLLDVDFRPQDLCILGGRNGYGKTTIFDAIELVVTGKIARLNHFNDYHNRSYKYNHIKLPLVFYTALKYVKIELLFQIDNKRFWLKRQAEVAKLSNPIKFDPFSDVFIAYVNNDNDTLPNDDQYSKIDNKELKPLLSNSLVEKFGFLHYLDQEDSDIFIKSNTKNRRESIQSLFDISNFDEDRTKLEGCSQALNDIQKRYGDELKKLNLKVEQIMSSISYTTETDCAYVRLMPSQKWDIENPKLTVELYNEIVGQYGILDNAENYIRNITDYKSFALKRFVTPYYNEKTLNTIAEYVHYSKETELLELHKIVRGVLKRILESSDWDWIDRAYDQTLNAISKYINPTDIERIKAQIKFLKLRSKDFTKIQRDYSQLLHQRNSLVSLFQSDSFNQDSSCPLCGYDYKERELLVSQMKQEGELLKELIQRETNGLQTSITEFRVDFNNTILNPLQKLLSQQGVTDQVVLSVENTDIRSFLHRLSKDFGINIEKTVSFLSTHSNVVDRFEKINSLEINDGIDFNRIEAFLTTFRQDIKQESFTLENIEKKRIYIQSQWIPQSSEQINNLNKQIEEIRGVLSIAKIKYDGIRTIITDLDMQKKKYVEALISDIEILFYIYSGRIMQTCHYGRGVFLKYDSTAKASTSKVLFVAGDYKHDVDALLSMSSGQLSAIVIAFILALNKLYGDVKFIAIDDPVQTMDDMNFWGFIETIRHEFNDYNILLSTHEERFGGLMRYKTEMLGMKSHYFDTKDFRTFAKEKD